MDYSELYPIVRFLYLICFIVIGNLTVPLCLFIIFTSIYKTGPNDQFRYVIASLAFINLCCGLNLGAVQPIFIINGPINKTSCQIAGYFLFCSVMWAIAYAPVLACSRLQALLYPQTYKLYFKKYYCILYLSVTFIGSLLVSLSLSNEAFEAGFEYGWNIDTLVPNGVDIFHEYMTNSSEIKLSYTFTCSINFKEGGWSIYLGLIFFATSVMTSVGVMVFKIFGKIKEQRNLIASLNNIQRNRLKENTNLMILVIVQGFTPMVLSFPYFTSFMVGSALNLHSYPTTAILTIPFFASCLSDSIFSICMVKPYRKSFIHLAKNVWTWIRFKQTGPIPTAAAPPLFTVKIHSIQNAHNDRNMAALNEPEGVLEEIE